ncbi:MAG: right-handed parallel beta-helix repeat-containing protein [Planctomycetota bacterium]
MSLCSAALARDYYVSTRGSDKNLGTREKPFLTIQKAVDKMGAGDTCYVRGGVYREVVQPKRSGRKDKPIRFEAWPGEVVTLSGTKPIRSEWSVHEGNIYRTRVPEDFDQLFVDGRMMIEARWPNMRFDQRFDKSVWATAGKGSAYGTMVDPALAETRIDWSGATATLNVGSWQTWRRTVRNHKAGSNRFAYDRNLSSRLESKRKWEGFDHYFLSGKLEALDIPTEWHLDRNSRTLYLWVPDGDNPAGHNVEAKVRDYVFDAYKREFIELRGFHFFGATFRFIECNHCIIDGCHLRFPVWAHGLDPAPLTLADGSDNIMRNCSVVYSDGPAVTMSGASNTLENCLFHDIDWHGLIRGLGVNTGASAASVIRRCTMFNIGSSEGLVLPSKGPSVVEYNYIHHVGLVQSDGALIQSHGIQLSGTIIRYNWVHDHNAFNWGGNGIRGDDLTRNLLVHHNVAWNCREKGIIVKGDHNRVFNNTCLHNQKIDIIAPSRAEPFKPWAPKQHPYLLEKQNANTHIANNCAPVITGTFSWQKTEAPPLGRVENNYRGKDPMLADPPEVGMIKPGVAGPAGRDFRPQAGSPLIDAGKPIPGITDGYRGKAPDIGAYEFGGQRWLPGCHNGLWISAPQKQSDGTLVVRIALRMPPTEPVFITVAAGNPNVSLKTGETLTFTPANWMHVQTVILRGYGSSSTARGSKRCSLQFSDKHLGSAEISDVWAIDPRLGRVVTFDLP